MTTVSLSIALFKLIKKYNCIPSFVLILILKISLLLGPLIIFLFAYKVMETIELSQNYTPSYEFYQWSALLVVIGLIFIGIKVSTVKIQNILIEKFFFKIKKNIIFKEKFLEVWLLTLSIMFFMILIIFYLTINFPVLLVICFSYLFICISAYKFLNIKNIVHFIDAISSVGMVYIFILYTLFLTLSKNNESISLTNIFLSIILIRFFLTRVPIIFSRIKFLTDNYKRFFET
jgi:hypothetical protein